LNKPICDFDNRRAVNDLINWFVSISAFYGVPTVAYFEYDKESDCCRVRNIGSNGKNKIEEEVESAPSIAKIAPNQSNQTKCFPEQPLSQQILNERWIEGSDLFGDGYDYIQKLMKYGVVQLDPHSIGGNRYPIVIRNTPIPSLPLRAQDAHV
jgi:hypothetical protein